MGAGRLFKEPWRYGPRILMVINCNEIMYHLLDRYLGASSRPLREVLQTFTPFTPLIKTGHHSIGVQEATSGELFTEPPTSP